MNSRPFDEQPSYNYSDCHCNLPNVFSTMQKKEAKIHYCDELDQIFQKYDQDPVKAFDDARKILFPKCRRIISVASDTASRAETIQFAEAFPDVYFATGIHPLYAKEYSDENEKQLVASMNHKKCIALGEIGLDYHNFGSQSNYAGPELQKKVFVQQIQLALAAKKPIILHSRQAESDTLSLLTTHVPPTWPLHLHCFTDTPEFLSKLLSYFRNLYVSFAGQVAFLDNRAKKLHKVVAIVPIDRLLLETDGPFLCPFRGYVNHPGFIPYIVPVLYEARKEHGAKDNLSLEEFCAKIEENVKRCFSIP